MTTSISSLSANAPTSDHTRDAELRAVARQLEGVFVQQLFKAMRETVPRDGITSGGAGEDMFTQLLDEHLSSAAPSRLGDGVSEALVRQLRMAMSGHDLPAPEAGGRVPSGGS